ncbi:hypothetical protein GQ55_2G244200 [Panicum hallii var. hallii]|uniref:Uncharacterized protein n=1 Tax=Panicum hallii var. hallii TaxID=1504633 RepID=A0A2T7ERY4_9POAL|nr:hypothetical protein GQ55_2G244200 [Panicum hallii var. hallii]
MWQATLSATTTITTWSFSISCFSCRSESCRWGTHKPRSMPQRRTARQPVDQVNARLRWLLKLRKGASCSQFIQWRWRFENYSIHFNVRATQGKGGRCWVAGSMPFKGPGAGRCERGRRRSRSRGPGGVSERHAPLLCSWRIGRAPAGASQSMALWSAESGGGYRPHQLWRRRGAAREQWYGEDHGMVHEVNLYSSYIRGWIARCRVVINWRAYLNLDRYLCPSIWWILHSHMYSSTEYRLLLQSVSW